MSTIIREIVPHGKTRYVQGDFYSKKNKCNFPYKSSYELAYLHQLEADAIVVSYIYEPFNLYYIDSTSKQRIYKPDFMVLYSDGKVLITEVKPIAMLGDFDVQAKAKSAREYIKDNYKDVDISYKFITEKHLFNGDKEYQDFLKSIK